MNAPELTDDIARRLDRLIASELAAIAGLDAATAREEQPEYVALFQDAKLDKQANVEQLTTVSRMSGRQPTESAGFRKHVQKVQAALAEHIGTVMTLRAMSTVESALVKEYTDALHEAGGIAAVALRKALGRTIVHWHVLTAHIARWTGTAEGDTGLPHPLAAYFVGTRPKSCLRCHLDRPSKWRPLTRTDPHPYQYLCGACHEEVRLEFPPDIAAQMDRWPAELQEARVLQHASGRVSKLNAAHGVLHVLSGLEAEMPMPAEGRASTFPEQLAQAPPVASRIRRDISPVTEAESAYVAQLFDFRSVREFW